MVALPETKESVAAAPDRATYIGSTDISALMGANPYKSALDVYARKLRLVEDLGAGEAAEWGLRLEPVIAEKYAEVEGVKLIKGAWIRGPKPYIGGTPDYLVDAIRRGVDCKAPGFRMADAWGEPGSDDVPEEYAIQCHYFMGLTGFSRWDLAVLIGGQEFRVYRINRDEELSGYLFEVAEKFWRDHIEKEIPPRPDGSDSAREILAKLWKRHRPELLQANDDIEAMAERLRVAMLEQRAADEKRQAAENDLKAVIADAAGIQGTFGRITWRQAKDGERVDLKALRTDSAAMDAIRKYVVPKSGGRRFLTPWTKQKNHHEGEE